MDQQCRRNTLPPEVAQGSDVPDTSYTIMQQNCRAGSHFTLYVGQIVTDGWIGKMFIAHGTPTNFWPHKERPIQHVKQLLFERHCARSDFQATAYKMGPWWPM